MRIVGLRLICHHFFLSTRRSSRKSLRILYHSVLNKGQCKSQHETGEGVQLSMSFFADAYPRQIDVLTHISPFWRGYESNDNTAQSHPLWDAHSRHGYQLCRGGTESLCACFLTPLPR